MEAVRKSWTDDRLDDFRDRVEERFDAIDRRFDLVERRLDRIEDRLDALQRMLVHGVIAMTGAMIAGFVAILSVLATQL